MSYLNPLRLHFSGRFQANVSTVNNDPGHFDNAAFKPNYQLLQSSPNGFPDNGWFNPTGDASWRLLDCKVTSAWLPSGAVPSSDPILAYMIADSDGRVAAKLVDLDTEQQLVSEIWGLQVRITDGQGNTLLRGDFEPAPFIDIWDRVTGDGFGQDEIAGAMYQSVLTNLKWADVSRSPFLTQLKESGDRLSIKFNVDGFNGDNTSDQFMCGRIAGTIGPSSADEPMHMVIGRQFMAESAPGGQFFKPTGGINFFAACVDAASSTILLDLGNAITTAKPGGPMNDLGNLELRAGSTSLGTISSQGNGGYTSDTWYAETAGVVQIKLPGHVTPASLNVPLTLSVGSNVLISEWNSGTFVRADTFVYRCSPGDSVQIPIYATQWGKRLSQAMISIVPDSSQLQPANIVNPFDVPPVATPLFAVAYVDDREKPTPLYYGFNGTLKTNEKGIATLTLQMSDPGTPRKFNNGQDYGIDGQIYGIRPGFVDTNQYTGPMNPWNFISILLWSGFDHKAPVDWLSLKPIFQQYANLYPVMARFLDMGSYEQVVANAALLKLAFGLRDSDPNSMPVTRDLSPAKRRAILQFLGDPVYGSAPETIESARTLAAPATPAAARGMTAGGKASASARRLVR
ncbi:hypothetical protein [Burkholderia sp. MSMB1589WGS]|uniref:hypothetical protein n=1 Tax=Burkholderia sp. MSMB1589WGS TaxID=1636425 RepID=UPI000B0A578E|nr:hypothetical protein [Burkholderia sp. MSMB1589WGS]